MTSFNKGDRVVVTDRFRTFYGCEGIVTNSGPTETRAEFGTLTGSFSDLFNNEALSKLPDNKDAPHAPKERYEARENQSEGHWSVIDTINGMGGGTIWCKSTAIDVANAMNIAHERSGADELAAALRPLAVFTPRCFYELPDDHIVYKNGGKALTAGDFRLAAEALAKYQGDGS